jgi:hypothetical protein
MKEEVDIVGDAVFKDVTNNHSEISTFEELNKLRDSSHSTRLVSEMGIIEILFSLLGDKDVEQLDGIMLYYVILILRNISAVGACGASDKENVYLKYENIVCLF